MSQVASVYAQGLYSLAREEQQEETFLQQLEVLREAFSQEPDFLRLLSSHNLTKQERCQVLEDSFRDRVHPYILNFMKLLTEKSYIRQFPQCCKAFTELYTEAHNILPVQAVSAVALSQEQKDRLTRKLEAITGKTVQLSCRIDGKCLGGLRLASDGRRVDGTVGNNLSEISKMLKNTVLEVEGRNTMELRPEEITKIIRSQIKNYEKKLEASETGVVILVGDGISKVSGLDKCMAG